jgi:hypothetical protein
MRAQQAAPLHHGYRARTDEHVIVRFTGLMLLGMVLVGCGAWSSQEPQVDGASSVTITAPQPGQVVHGEVVDISYRLIRGRADDGDHVHLWLDGQNEGFSLRSPKRLRDVGPGNHTVRVRVATSGHRFPGPEATVSFRKE